MELQRERERERGNELRELRKSREVRLSVDKNLRRKGWVVCLGDLGIEALRRCGVWKLPNWKILALLFLFIIINVFVLLEFGNLLSLSLSLFWDRVGEC